MLSGSQETVCVFKFDVRISNTQGGAVRPSKRHTSRIVHCQRIYSFRHELFKILSYGLKRALVCMYASMSLLNIKK